MRTTQPRLQSIAYASIATLALLALLSSHWWAGGWRGKCSLMRAYSPQVLRTGWEPMR